MHFTTPIIATFLFGQSCYGASTPARLRGLRAAETDGVAPVASAQVPVSKGHSNLETRLKEIMDHRFGSENCYKSPEGNFKYYDCDSPGEFASLKSTEAGVPIELMVWTQSNVDGEWSTGHAKFYEGEDEKTAVSAAKAILPQYKNLAYQLIRLMDQKFGADKCYDTKETDFDFHNCDLPGEMAILKIDKKGRAVALETWSESDVDGEWSTAEAVFYTGESTKMAISAADAILPSEDKSLTYELKSLLNEKFGVKNCYPLPEGSEDFYDCSINGAFASLKSTAGGEPEALKVWARSKSTGKWETAQVDFYKGEDENTAVTDAAAVLTWMLNGSTANPQSGTNTPSLATKVNGLLTKKFGDENCQPHSTKDAKYLDCSILRAKATFTMAADGVALGVQVWTQSSVDNNWSKGDAIFYVGESDKTALSAVNAILPAGLSNGVLAN